MLDGLACVMFDNKPNFSADVISRDQNCIQFNLIHTVPLTIEIVTKQLLRNQNVDLNP